MLSLQLVNNAHRADDAETLLREQLKEEARVRKALLLRTPALAVEYGLPSSGKASFEKSLLALEAQIIEEDPITVGSIGTSASDSIPPPARKVAVW